MTQDNRLLPRLLCSDHFSECLLFSEGEKYQAKSINYNRLGMAIFSPQPLPAMDSATLSFAYVNDVSEIRVTHIAIRFAYISELDVGCKYGLSFQLEHAAPCVLEQLRTIEDALQQDAPDGDRYGLFS